MKAKMGRCFYKTSFANYPSRSWADSPSEGSSRADTLMSDFSPPRTGRNTFFLFKPPSLWHFLAASSEN